MIRIGLVVLLMCCAASARAQNFVSYSCADGTPVSAALFTGDNRIRIQFDGKSYALPRRISASGTRYSKSGVSFWIKGDNATLKRPKAKRTTCKAT